MRLPVLLSPFLPETSMLKNTWMTSLRFGGDTMFEDSYVIEYTYEGKKEYMLGMPHWTYKDTEENRKIMSQMVTERKNGNSQEKIDELEKKLERFSKADLRPLRKYIVTEADPYCPIEKRRMTMKEFDDTKKFYGKEW